MLSLDQSLWKIQGIQWQGIKTFRLHAPLVRFHNNKHASNTVPTSHYIVGPCFRTVVYKPMSNYCQQQELFLEPRIFVSISDRGTRISI